MEPQLVTAKQPNSKMCLVCGLANIAGLQARFFETKDGQVTAIFAAQPHHQGYPTRLHGGLVAAILDETIGRAIRVGRQDDVWGVTMELTTRYRKPIPLAQTIRVVARITRETRRHFEGTGEVLLDDHSVAAEGRGKYLRLTPEQLEEFGEFDPVEQEWRITPEPSDPRELLVPGQSGTDP